MPRGLNLTRPGRGERPRTPLALIAAAGVVAFTSPRLLADRVEIRWDDLDAPVDDEPRPKTFAGLRSAFHRAAALGRRRDVREDCMETIEQGRGAPLPETSGGGTLPTLSVVNLPPGVPPPSDFNGKVTRPGGVVEEWRHGQRLGVAAPATGDDVEAPEEVLAA